MRYKEDLDEDATIKLALKGLLEVTEASGKNIEARFEADSRGRLSPGGHHQAVWHQLEPWKSHGKVCECTCWSSGCRMRPWSL